VPETRAYGIREHAGKLRVRFLKGDEWVSYWCCVDAGECDAGDLAAVRLKDCSSSLAA
jgi:hypothetical protein